MKLIIAIFLFSVNSIAAPTQWTCTLRTSSAGAGTTATASCTGSEKLDKGGCDADLANTVAIESRPSGQGWVCTWGNISGVTYANCCQ